MEPLSKLQGSNAARGRGPQLTSCLRTVLTFRWLASSADLGRSWDFETNARKMQSDHRAPHVRCCGRGLKTLGGIEYLSKDLEDA
jgi:hypothetical protein